MTTRVLPVFVAGISYAAVLGALGACTSLLGSFDTAKGEVSASSGSGPTQAGGGGAGGGSGAGGAGGGAPVAPLLACSWSNGSHQAFQSSGGADAQFEGLRIAARPGGARPRLLTSEWHPSTMTRSLGIYSPESGNAIFVKGVERLLDVQRLGDSAIGVLATSYDQVEQGLSLVMLVIPDAPDMLAAASVQTVKLVSAKAWPPDARPDLMGGRFSGRFVVTVPMNAANTGWRIHYVVSYQSTTSQHIATFGEAAGDNTATRLFMLTPPGYGKTENDNDIVALMHIDGKDAPSGKATDYVYLGQPFQGGKSGEFAVLSTTAGQVMPRDLGSSVLVGAAARPDGINLAFAALSSKFELRTHKLPFASLGKFTANDVPITVTFDGFGYLPVGDSSVAWFGDLFTLLGTSGQGGDTPLGYALFDAYSNERGHGTLPFTGNLPMGVTRTGPQSLAVTEGASLQSNLLRNFEVAWLDGQKLFGGETRVVLYYDRLECLATGNSRK